jgi:hypothetical protein
MTTKKIWNCLLLAVLLTSFVLTRCKEVTVTTKVNKDGSCIRTIVAKPDSEDIANTFWPMPKDDSWAIETTTQKNEDDEDEYIYKAEKKFPRVSDLNREFTVKDSNDTTVAISCPVTLTKKYAFVYTKLYYEETYKAYNQCTLVPISDVLTEEQQALIGDDDHEEYSDIYEEWLLKKNLLEEFYQNLVREGEKLAHPQLTVARIKEHKELLLKAVDDASGDTAEEVLPQFVEEMSEILGTDAAMQLEEPLLLPTRLLFKRFFLMADMDDDEYINKVIMPGRIIATNATSLDGNVTTWEIKANDWRFKDYVMSIESKVINWTSIVIAGIFIFLLLVLTVVILTRRRSNTSV